MKGGKRLSVAKVYIGIDVAKEWLDVAVRPGGDAGRYSNDEAGIAHLLEHLIPLKPSLVVFEATGGLEMPLTGALVIAHLPVVVLNPRQVRDFARPLASWLRLTLSMPGC